jgi:4-hydroxy-3-methylbut-2-enyl diphosphate reductase
MGERILPTYFIKNAGEIVGSERIRHWNQHAQQVEETRNWLPKGNITIGITAGASCPNNLIEEVITHLFDIRGSSNDQLLYFN